MTRKAIPKDFRKLFDHKERMLEEQPGQNQSYTQFLQDWKQYKRSQEGNKHTKVSRSNSAFGASFKKE